MIIKGKIAKVYFTTAGTSAIMVNDGSNRVRAYGKVNMPLVGNDIEMEGEWINHPKYGRQFSVIDSKISEEMSEEGIISYLSSGFIKGVGEKLAKRIVDKFGKNTLKIIETDPERLVEVSGISATKMESICKAHSMHRVYLDLIDFFNGLATDFQIKTIYEKYKEESIKVLRDNPYILVDDIKGFGFKKADSLARKAGIKDDDPRRLSAAIIFVLNAIATMGHCYAMQESLIKAALEQLDTSSINENMLKEAIQKRIDNGSIIDDNGRLYLKELYTAENETAKIIAKLIKSKNLYVNQYKIDKCIENFENNNNFELEEKQKEAVKKSVLNSLSVITGGPGTGKTTIINAILHVLKNASIDGNEIPVRLVAPTGKAAKRITEATNNEVHATTIHKLLIEGFLKYNGFIIVDETSMVDIVLAHKMLELAKNSNSNVILIGDMYQLPSIGPGNFFRDLIDEPEIETITLDLCYRQTGNIAYNAKMINEGKRTKEWKLNGDSFNYLLKESEDVQNTVINEYLELLKIYDVKDICCIVPTRQAPKVNDEKKRTCSDTLNELIREKINPEKTNEPKLKGCKFRVGDRIMNTVNDYEKGVFNGDCGTIIDIDVEENSIWIAYDSGDIIEYSPTELSNLKLAYAITVHKSQGSEYKAIVMAQAMEHYILLQRNLLYTGVTRASEKVVLIADKNSVNIALNKNDAITRSTQLKNKIEKSISNY